MPEVVRLSHALPDDQSSGYKATPDESGSKCIAYGVSPVYRALLTSLVVYDWAFSADFQLS